MEIKSTVTIPLSDYEELKGEIKHLKMLLEEKTIIKKEHNSETLTYGFFVGVAVTFYLLFVLKIFP